MKINLKFKLPKKFKEKWLKALRSKKYKQQRQGQLVVNGRFCCLGVAGVVCGVKIEDMEDFSFLGSPCHSNKVPKTVFKAFRQPMSVVDSLGSVDYYLAGMNDGHKSFKQIANWIEKHL